MVEYNHLEKASSCQDSLMAIESDIQHANMLAASISRAKGGACLQMKLVNNHLAPIFFFLFQWFDCSCASSFPSYLTLFHIVVYKVHIDGKQKFPSHGRKATIRQFYAVILPTLEHLHGSSLRLYGYQDEGQDPEMIVGKKLENNNKTLDVDLEREDECGICLEPCTKIVLPNCCHAMCINCYRDWNVRSESCPFCRGSLKRVNSGDLWVLTCGRDVVDQETLSKEDILRLDGLNPLDGRSMDFDIVKTSRQQVDCTSMEHLSGRTESMKTSNNHESGALLETGTSRSDVTLESSEYL